MQRHAKEFQQADVRIVVVTFEPAARASAYLDENEIPWPVLVDETRHVYRAYGMLAGRYWDIWGPPTWWAYLKELARGRGLAAQLAPRLLRSCPRRVARNGAQGYHPEKQPRNIVP